MSYPQGTYGSISGPGEFGLSIYLEEEVKNCLQGVLVVFTIVHIVCSHTVLDTK